MKMEDWFDKRDPFAWAVLLAIPLGILFGIGLAIFVGYYAHHLLHWIDG
jgi:hypothetical protein